MNSNFEILISSDIDYDDLCAEIFYQGNFLAIISQEEGFENLDIEIYPPINQERWQFKYSEFENVLQCAKQRLWELRKFPENS